MPVALVTGANKGIGLEIARQLGKHAFTVYVGARNPALGEAAAAKLRSANLDARNLLLDLNQPPTSHAATRTIQNDCHHLDVLVNNAAIVHPADGPPGAVSTDMNPQGTLTTEEGASEPVRLALLPADGPTGGFFHSAGSYPW